MKSTVKLSEIFWQAANCYLAVEHENDKDNFSCLAVTSAVLELAGRGKASHELEHSAESFLETLGCDIDGSNLFNEFVTGLERQGARYAWLMFASLYAKELGL